VDVDSVRRIFIGRKSFTRNLIFKKRAFQDDGLIAGQGTNVAHTLTTPNPDVRMTVSVNRARAEYARREVANKGAAKADNSRLSECLPPDQFEEPIHQILSFA